MANGKKSVLLYCDIIHTVEKLSNENAGILFKHYLRYVNDQNPEPVSDLIDIVFEPIKQNLKRDLKKWDGIIQNRSVAGKAGAEARWQNIAKDGKRIDEMAKIAVKDTVTVIVNDKDIIKEENLINDFFRDLPNSSHLEKISMNINIPIETLKLKIPEFRKAANLTYPSMIKFAEHFKNWVLKQPAQAQTPKRRLL